MFQPTEQSQYLSYIKFNDCPAEHLALSQFNKCKIDCINDDAPCWPVVTLNWDTYACKYICAQMIVCVSLDSTYKDTSCSLGKIVFPNCATLEYTYTNTSCLLGKIVFPNFQSCTTIFHIECICTIIYHFNKLTIITKSNLYTLNTMKSVYVASPLRNKNKG